MKGLWPGLSLLVLLVTAYPVAAQPAGRIESITGRAEVVRTGRAQPAVEQQELVVGDVIRTGPGSRVALRLADATLIKLNGASWLELKQVGPPPGRAVPVAQRALQTILRLLEGELWSRSRGERLEIETPSATATIRGTELNLAIGPAADSRLAVLDGVVELRNLQGSVLVQAGEQGTAKVGEAPRKSVLVNPVDAVQWTLYYPGIVSFRDYPLTSVDAVRLPQSVVEAERRVGAEPGAVDGWIRLGELLFDLGRRAEARRAFERALGLAPQDARAHAGLGWTFLADGKVPEALTEFQRARPPTLPALVGAANALYRLDRFEEAGAVIAEARRNFPASPQPRTQAALLALVQGRVAEAISELMGALAVDPRSGLAHGLLSNVYLVQNKNAEALKEAQGAVAANPTSPTAHLDLSLVRQAEFRLEEALREAQRAVELDPEDPVSLIQVSRLLFGLDRRAEAFEVAERARRIAPREPLVATTWGFLQLARGKVPEAMAAFEQAIQADSTRGEPHLGLGLALFRRGQTREAVEEMQIATLLEPQVSLFHSYLGKAFYEVKRDTPAQQEFATAKRLDPRDPTPWFYDAIRNETINRPVEALQEVQRSIELNDNRAVYRSRLLLDDDLAARSASLARIYTDLNFQQLALVEGWTSLNAAPNNYSAHRLLADSYAALPGYQIASASELLQAQLLQPINITPVRPRLADSTALILRQSASPDLSANEFGSLFARNGYTLQGDFIVGTDRTFGDDLILSAIHDRLSASLGQFHFETNGFRANNDLTQDIYDFFLQWRLTPAISLQAEVRQSNSENGDLALNFDPRDFSRTRRQSLDTTTLRLGLHYASPPSSDLIVSVVAQRLVADVTLTDLFTFQGAVKQIGGSVEVQYLYRSQSLHLISGLGHFQAGGKESITISVSGETLADSDSTITPHSTNLYSYLNVDAIPTITLTFGAAIDFVTDDSVAEEQFDPKFGLTWQPVPNTTIRAAAFRVLRRHLISDQTIEPTTVAGFNQFFNDPIGATFWRYGVGVDQRFSPRLFGGVELSRRDLKIPFIFVDPTSGPVPVSETRQATWREDFGRAYLYWTAARWLGLRAEYFYERLVRSREFPAGVLQSNTHRVPLGVDAYHPGGLIARVTASFINQDGVFEPQGGAVFRGRDRFWVIDASVGYRLPRRWGVVTVGATNITNETFRFEDKETELVGEASDFGRITAPLIRPGRFVYARLTLAY